jgi:hypothetical protein
MNKNEMAWQLLLAHVQSKGLKFDEYTAQINDMSYDEFSEIEADEDKDEFDELSCRDEVDKFTINRLKIEFDITRYEKTYTKGYTEETIEDDLDYQYYEEDSYECNEFLNLSRAFGKIRRALDADFGGMIDKIMTDIRTVEEERQDDIKIRKIKNKK